MRKKNDLTSYISGLILLMSSCSIFAADTVKEEKNTSLSDSRVLTQFLPIEKLTVGNSIGYVFIDKTSVKLHPYNDFIRTYTRIVNYGPALLLGEDDEAVSYRSVVTQEFANCDKKEFAKGLVENYEHYFGAGKKQNSDNLPKRWEATAQNSKERQNLIVICSLPLNR